MNIYIVVEGERATKKLYKYWISYVNNKLSPINYLQEFNQNNFFILAGHGQPGIWSRVGTAVDDVNKLQIIDRLVISIDAEDRGYEDKLLEAKSHIDNIGCRVDVRYIVQYFCLETWLLGNITLFRKKPQDDKLRQFLQIHDIRINNPDLLPPHKEYSWNRSQFAYRYLKAGIRDIYDNNKSYSKKDPGLAITEGFYNQVRKRCFEKNHISSFKDFTNAFI